MSPDQYTPQKPDDFVGMAAMVCMIQLRRMARKSAIKLLLYGDPGCGKSAICRVLANTVADTYNISRTSACELNAETMRDWIDEGRYRRDTWRVYHIDECDAINPTVEILMLQFLDDLPERTAVLCTSNRSMGELSDRFQSRFHPIEIERPSPDLVQEFLLKHWPRLGDHAGAIAEATSGDVRAALNDAQAYLDFEEMQA